MSNYKFALNRLGSLTKEYREGYISKHDFETEVEFLVSRISDIYEASDIRDLSRKVLADPNYKLPLPEPKLPKHEAKKLGGCWVFFAVLVYAVIGCVIGVIVSIPFAIGFSNEGLGGLFALLGLIIGGLIGKWSTD